MKFHVINVRKIIRNSDIEHIIVLDAEDYPADADIEYAVRDWAEFEGSGSTYGYKLEWEVETDIAAIRDALRCYSKELYFEQRKIENERKEVDLYLHSLLNK